MRRASRRDENEAAIVEALRKAGAAVELLDGDGTPDLLVSFGDVLHLLEVKNPNAKGGGKYNTGDGCLTASQTRWWKKWTGVGPVIVYTAQDALKAIGAEARRDKESCVSGKMGAI